MKKYLPALALMTALISCKENATPQKGEELKKTQQPAVQAVPIKAGGCSEMVIFQKGRKIQNVTRDSTGRVTVQSENTILNVEEKDGIMVSTMQIIAPGEVPSVTQYGCNGSLFYIDMVSLMGNMEGMTKIKSNRAQMEFPLNMNVGDTLKSTSLHMTFSAGEADMVLLNELDGRRVESRETVSTAAGSWECYKISAVMHIKSTMQSAKIANNKPMQMQKELKMVSYFTPNVGLVKMEIFKGDRLASSSEITAIR